MEKNVYLNKHIKKAFYTTLIYDKNFFYQTRNRWELNLVLKSLPQTSHLMMKYKYFP